MNANLLSLFWEGFELENYEAIAPDTLFLRLQPRASQPPAVVLVATPYG